MRFAPQQPRPDSDGNLGRVMAMDLATQRVQWTHRQRAPMSSSLLATAGGLVFTGDLGRKLQRLRPGDGKRLWRTQLPAAASPRRSPIPWAASSTSRWSAAKAAACGRTCAGWTARSLGAPQSGISPWWSSHCPPIEGFALRSANRPR